MTTQTHFSSPPLRSTTPNTATPSDSEVLRGLADLRPQMYARALRLARCPSRAEDIVQDTMVRALRFETQYHAGTNLRAWVGQVLMSVFLTQCRRNKRERRALDNLTRDPCAGPTRTRRHRWTASRRAHAERSTAYPTVTVAPCSSSICSSSATARRPYASLCPSEPS
jgi:DNA-directed RNA polymerase specialized sigma24 family protein